MKQLFRSSIHESEKSHDCLICDIKGKKVKITYEAYNAVEQCNTEFFDGDKWNLILTMLDMGFLPEKSAYIIWDENKRKKRVELLFKTSQTLCDTIL